jgi:serine/threonine protein kinase
MGVVYLAEHTRLRRKAALKILAADLALDEKFRRRFIRESELAASIDHPTEEHRRRLHATKPFERLHKEVKWTGQVGIFPNRASLVRRVATLLREQDDEGQVAEQGQLLRLECEMPQCCYHKGRGSFDPRTTPLTDWARSPDHYPILKSAGGKLRPENVRLSHVVCNNRDHGWRTRVKTMLGKGKALDEIAAILNDKGIPPAHGTNRWTAAMVRKAYVS